MLLLPIGKRAVTAHVLCDEMSFENEMTFYYKAANMMLLLEQREQAIRSTAVDYSSISLLQVWKLRSAAYKKVRVCIYVIYMYDTSSLL